MTLRLIKHAAAGAIVAVLALAALRVTAQVNPLAIPPDEMPEICSLDWQNSPETFSAQNDADTVKSLTTYWFGGESDAIADTVQAVFTNQYVAADGTADGQSILITLWQFASPAAAETAVDTITAKGARNIRSMLDYNQAVMQKYNEVNTQECADWMWREIERGMGR